MPKAPLSTLPYQSNSQSPIQAQDWASNSEFHQIKPNAWELTKKNPMHGRQPQGPKAWGGGDASLDIQTCKFRQLKHPKEISKHQWEGKTNSMIFF